MNRKGGLIAVLASFLFFLPPTLCLAQVYKAGELVVFKYFGEETEGQVVKQDASGVLIRHKTLQGIYDPKVSHEAFYTLDKIVRRGPLKTEKAAPAAAPAKANPAANANNPAAEPGGAGAKAPAAVLGGDGKTATPAGGAPMSQEEILKYLNDRIGTDPWSHKDKPKVVAELAALIRERGVGFRPPPVLDPYWDKLRNSGGNESTIPFAIQANVGPPAKQAWLMGDWALIKIGGRTRFERNGRLYERQESGAKSGKISIKTDGSYHWDSPSGKFDGKWRPATKEEMAINYQGGAGVVLLKAKGGWDWIVSKSTNLEFQGDSIDIKEITSRQVIEYGGRL